MKVHHPFRTAAAATLLGLAASAPASAVQTLYWPSFAASPSDSIAPQLIGKPDLSYRLDPARAAKFELRGDYATLAAEMGLSDAEFAEYELIAWEGNGGSPGSSGGFESVSFVFDDFRTAVAARYDEVTDASDNPAVRFRTGSIAGSRFDAVFGISGAEPVMSWLLVDLPASVNVHSPSFSVRFAPGGLSAGGLGEGSPDIDAIGVIATVPEPGTWVSMGLGLLALGYAARRRKRERLAPRESCPTARRTPPERALEK